MMMGDFQPVMVLQAELRHVREQKQYLERLAAEGPPGLQREIQHCQRKEARLLADLKDEEQRLDEVY